MKASTRRSAGTTAAIALALGLFAGCAADSDSDRDGDEAGLMGLGETVPATAAGWPEQAAFCEALRPFEVTAVPLLAADRADQLDSLRDLAPLEWRTILEKSASRSRLGEPLDDREASDFSTFTIFAEANCGVDLPDLVPAFS